MVPLALAATGETVSQRGGVITLGLEGCMTLGAYAGLVATLGTHRPELGLLAGLVAGGLLALFSAWFAVVRGEDQVVVGTAVNLLAAGVTLGLFQSRFSQTGQLLQVPALPKLIGGFDLVGLGLPFVVAGAGWLLFRTAWGLALRGAGEKPAAVEAAGFSPVALRVQGTAISGALGGLGGAYLVVGVTQSFANDIVAGRGFLAIAMVTFGRWKPVWVALAAALVGVSDSLQYELQARGVSVSYQLTKALPYVVALAVLVAVGSGRDVPQALGRAVRRKA